LRQGQQNPEAYNELYATAMAGTRGVQVVCTPRIGWVGPVCARTSSIGGVQLNCTPWIWHYPWRTGKLYASHVVPRQPLTHPPNSLWRAPFVYATAMAVAVAYSFPVRLRYVAVVYGVLCTPLITIPPMTYFLVVCVGPSWPHSVSSSVLWKLR
jgi:hypothetical protein